MRGIRQKFYLALILFTGLRVITAFTCAGIFGGSLNLNPLELISLLIAVLLISALVLFMYLYYKIYYHP